VGQGWAWIFGHHSLTTRLGKAGPGTAWYGGVGLGLDFPISYLLVQQGVARYGLVGLGRAGFGQVRHGKGLNLSKGGIDG
jgi:hypothetical protein